MQFLCIFMFFMQNFIHNLMFCSAKRNLRRFFTRFFCKKKLRSALRLAQIEIVFGFSYLE